ncbi:MAG: hypothetical protein BWY91_01691 [bacterium ADurb.BinA028]|nr:MAG: hypothetical protein BWY91_01691 [bacterium ADurb.BinA028]
MRASGLSAAPKSPPEAGIPPTIPGSVVRVIRSMTCSSAATVDTPSGIPIPRFTTPPSGNSMAARRAAILRSFIGIGGMRSNGMRTSWA